MAGLATSGTLIRWFRDELGARRDLARSCVAGGRGEPAGRAGPACLPYFSGERTPIHDPRARGAFFGLDLTHTRGDLFRAVLEGIAAGTAHVIETYREAGRRAARVLAVGGGTSNAVWLQATSDLGRVTQMVRERTIGASYGDAFLAAVAIGAAAPDDIDALEPRRADGRAPGRAGLRPPVPPLEGALPADARHLPTPSRMAAHDARRRGRARRGRSAALDRRPSTRSSGHHRGAPHHAVRLWARGLMMRALAMRLHHLGSTVCVQGDMTAFPWAPATCSCAPPAPASCDAPRPCAASRGRPALSVLVITAEPDGARHGLADELLVIPARRWACIGRQSCCRIGIAVEGALSWSGPVRARCGIARRDGGSHAVPVTTNIGVDLDTT